jgi:hypothetical protein
MCILLKCLSCYHHTHVCVSLASSSSRNDISEHDMCGWVYVCPHALRNTNHQTNVHTLKNSQCINPYPANVENRVSS